MAQAASAVIGQIRPSLPDAPPEPPAPEAPPDPADPPAPDEPPAPPRALAEPPAPPCALEEPPTSPAPPSELDPPAPSRELPEEQPKASAAQHVSVDQRPRLDARPLTSVSGGRFADREASRGIRASFSICAGNSAIDAPAAAHGEPDTARRRFRSAEVGLQLVERRFTRPGRRRSHGHRQP